MVPGDAGTMLSALHRAAFSSASRRTEVSPLTSLPCHSPWEISGCFVRGTGDAGTRLSEAVRWGGTGNFGSCSNSAAVFWVRG